MKVDLRLIKEPKLRAPFLISGLPGIGYIGKVTTDYLIQQLKAELFGKVYSHFFPSYVLIKENGVVELMENALYYWENIEFENDLILFTGNTQAVSPEGQYMIAEEVLNIAIKLGVHRIYSITAYVTDRDAEKPEVYAAGTERKLIEEMKAYGVLPMKESSIGGTNGLLFGLAKNNNLQGICLLGETHGYMTPSGRTLVDMKAARAVLEVLVKLLGIHLDMAPIETQADQTTKFIEKLEEFESRIHREIHEANSKNLSRYIT